MPLTEIYPWLAILPPLIAIGIAIAYRHVYAALIIGIWSGTTIMSGGNPVKGLSEAVELCVRVFQNPDSTRVILFSGLVGAVISFTQRSGGVQGFVSWLSGRGRISSRRRAQLMAMAVGISVPIESSISILVTGTVARPIFDKMKISREKLAYICDSTSAPVCSVIPVNAWGAYIAGLLAQQGINQPLLIFFKSILFNFYSLVALIFVFTLILVQKDFFSMKNAEKRAMEKGEVLRKDSMPLVSPEITDLQVKSGVSPKAVNMVIPVLSMIIVMIAGLFISGGGDITKGSGSTSVLWAVLSAIVVAGLMYKKQKIFSTGELTDLFFKGVGGLIPIASLMILAFALGLLCINLNTGAFTASIAKKVLIPQIVPFVIFIVTGFIAFSTGTSWGTWGIMIPIAVPIAAHMDINLLLITGAVVSGGVFGDHCSPISDTTMVSSMASACDHMDHVNTQLPYALTVGLFSGLLFLLSGFIF